MIGDLKNHQSCGHYNFWAIIKRCMSKHATKKSDSEYNHFPVKQYYTNITFAVHKL
jgi:hypothetical protein